MKAKNTYDEDGRVLTTTDGFGNSYTFSYDVNGSTTCYIYNARNQVESVTDVLGNVVTLAYDSNGNLSKETAPLGESRSYTYTSLGVVETITNEAGLITTYEYEIKPGSYAPGAVNNAAGKEQLNRYVQALSWTEEYVRAGTTLNPMVNMTMLPSMRHSDKLIKYYTYPQDPGMIYWSYVKKPQVETAPVKVEETEIDWATVAMYAVGSTAIVVGVAYLAYTGDPSMIQRGTECFQ